ncbi:MAG: transporter substrate-binding domain-containing protein, partial [Magnetococcales bacterium]|nr:transporter substrate-binding domain-containing protein [Magnetococcales bacterium]
MRLSLARYKPSILLVAFLLCLIIPAFYTVQAWGVEKITAQADNNNFIQLTIEEQAWINKNPVVKVGNEMDWPPFDYAQNGVAKGFSIDLVRKIGEKTGLDFEFINGHSWAELLKMTRDGKLDLLPATAAIPKRREYLAFSEPYLNYFTVLVVPDSDKTTKSLNDLKGKKVGIVKGYYYFDLAKKRFPDVDFVETSGFAEGLESVASGELEGFIGSRIVTKYTMQKSFINDLRIAGRSGVDDPEQSNLRISVRKDLPILLSVINKGLAAISEGEKSIIARKWMGFDSVAEQKKVTLTEKERIWRDEHSVVRLGVDPAWPPFDFINSKGEHDGLAADILQHVEKYIGVKFELAKNLTWNQVTEKTKNHDLDVISLSSKTPEREQFLTWSKPVVTMPLVVASKTDFNPISSVKELIGQRVVVAKGYAVVSFLREQYPEISFKEAATPFDGLQQVSVNMADVYIGYLGTISYHIRTDGLFNLKIAGPSGFPPTKLAIAVRSDWPELVDLINKGLDAFTDEEMNLIQKKWLPLLKDSIYQKETIDQNIWLLTIVACLVFIALLVVLLFLPRLFSDTTIAKHFGSSHFRVLALLGMSTMVAMVAILVWYTLMENKQRVLSSVSAELQVVLQNTMERYDFWIQNRLNLLSQLGRDPELVNLTKRLLAVPPTQNSLQNSKQLKKVRNFVADREEVFGKTGFFIINPDSISIGSSLNSNLGTKNLIATKKPNLLAQVFNGKPTFIPPIRSDVAIHSNSGAEEEADKKPLTMFFAVPIRNFDGTVIAVLTQRLIPKDNMSKIFHSGRIGMSGESYVIDHEGRMITKSRFQNQLYDIGLLDKESKEHQTLEVRDPGGEILKGFIPTVSRSEQPFTHMVMDIFRLKQEMEKRNQNESHSEIVVDVNGYRDYRGTKVFGAWMWMPHLMLGATTEIDVEEALAGYYSLRQNLFIITGLTLLLSTIATLLTIILGERATLIMRRNQEGLEQKVEERTQELIDSQERFELAVRGSGDALWEYNTCTNKNWFSPRFAEMLGYESHELPPTLETWKSHIHPDDLEAAEA